MTKLLATVASIAALIAGYLILPMWWLLLIGLGYFFPVCLSRYDQTILLLRHRRLGFVTFAFVWMYLASLAGVSITYGVGRVARWFIEFIF